MAKVRLDDAGISRSQIRPEPIVNRQVAQRRPACRAAKDRYAFEVFAMARRNDYDRVEALVSDQLVTVRCGKSRIPVPRMRYDERDDCSGRRLSRSLRKHPLEVPAQNAGVR